MADRYDELMVELQEAYLGHKETLATLAEARKDERFMREQILDLLEELEELAVARTPGQGGGDG